MSTAIQEETISLDELNVSEEDVERALQNLDPEEVIEGEAFGPLVDSDLDDEELLEASRSVLRSDLDRLRAQVNDPALAGRLTFLPPRDPELAEEADAVEKTDEGTIVRGLAAAFSEDDYRQPLQTLKRLRAFGLC